MAVMGISVRVRNGRPVVRGVVLPDGPPGQEIDKFSHTAEQGEAVADQMYRLAGALSSHMKARDIKRVLLYEADFTPKMNATAAALRNRAEGVVLATARGFTTDVQVVNGPQIGRIHGTNKAGCEEEAVILVDDVAFKEAGAAAIAARRLSDD